MATPNPACFVNGSLPPIDVAASSSITIALAQPAGAIFWSIQCTSTDELDTAAAVNATLVVNQTTKSATCSVSSVLGGAYIFTSTVGILGLGLDANATRQASFTTTFKVNVKASNNARVLAENETFEQSAAAGWVAVVNPALRAGVNVPISIGGTGFAHVTGGIIDLNAKGNFAVGDLNVTNSNPGIFDLTHQIAYCDTTTGTCLVTFPAPSAFPSSVIPPDWQLLVADTGGVAGTNAITVNPNGETIWDPIGLAFGTSNVTLALNGIAVLWQWDTNKGHWVTGSSVFSKNPVPGATITGPYTVQVTDQWKLYDATAGTIAFLLPGPGNETGASVGLTREFTHIAGNGTGGIYATFNGNGANVQDPSSWPTLASVGEVRTIGITTRIRWDGSVYRCVN